MGYDVKESDFKTIIYPKTTSQQIYEYILQLYEAFDMVSRREKEIYDMYDAAGRECKGSLIASVFLSVTSVLMIALFFLQMTILHHFPGVSFVIVVSVLVVLSVCTLSSTVSKYQYYKLYRESLKLENDIFKSYYESIQLDELWHNCSDFENSNPFSDYLFSKFRSALSFHNLHKYYLFEDILMLNELRNSGDDYVCKMVIDEPDGDARLYFDHQPPVKSLTFFHKNEDGYEITQKWFQIHVPRWFDDKTMDWAGNDWSSSEFDFSYLDDWFEKSKSSFYRNVACFVFESDSFPDVGAKNHINLKSFRKRR